MTRSVRVFVRGMVQGVGMRPAVARLARAFGVAGSVRNIGSNVEIVASADEERLDALIAALRSRKPEMSEILDISVIDDESENPPNSSAEHPPFVRGERDCGSEFTIVPSAPGEVTMLPPDFPVCADCIRELRDKGNRRFRHPFISCSVCGPRYSILSSAPYDRGTTSMADFPMCPACAREYAAAPDRRYHAQTVSCHECGPVLLYADGKETCEREDALGRAIAALKGGGIVAVKGVGGYHLACGPHDGQAVRRLRALKGREKKPFAVMFADMEALERSCLATESEKELLLSPARPIVLLETRGAPFASGVSGDARLTGAFLPYTPLQILLLDECTELVMTSANLTGKPEIYEDAEMLAMLGNPALAGVLYNERRIVTRLDDSVARVSAGQRQLIRRARGYAPRPVTIPPIACEHSHDNPPNRPAGHLPFIRGAGECGSELRSRNTQERYSPYEGEMSPLGDRGDCILAYGSDLKSAFCLLRGGEAFMSQYFGDIEEYQVLDAYVKNLEHMRKLFSFTPELAACDLHPGYHSSRLARASGLPLAEVQHHHAHAASVMAEHGLAGPVIGISFDGTGYGTDGAIWGGEFLVCEGGGFRRRAHLKYVKLAGGDSVAVDARKAAFCYRAAAGLQQEPFEDAELLESALRNDVNTVLYSGMGRLFDAASSMLGFCHYNGYEGECAVALENAAHRAVAAAIKPAQMDFAIEDSGDIEWAPVLRAVAQTGPDAEARQAAALGFHEAVCRMALRVCERIRGEEGIDIVTLSGGTFQNGLILSGCLKSLTEAGFRVYTNNEVPCNDGGLALGQAFIASFRGHLPSRIALCATLPGGRPLRER
jgi:hydrogenase maturation protein HypF